MIVVLPEVIDINEVDINPSFTCGDGGSASAGDYKVETSVDGVTWTTAATGHFTPADRFYHPITLNGSGLTGVKYVKFWMLSNQVGDLGGTCPDGNPGNFSGCDWVDATELGVYGGPAKL